MLTVRKRWLAGPGSVAEVNGVAVLCHDVPAALDAQLHEGVSHSDVYLSPKHPPHLLPPQVQLVKKVEYNGEQVEAAWPLGAAINSLG